MSVTMKRIMASLLLVLGCSSDTTGPLDSDGDGIPDDAQPTEVGTPTGQATSGSIGVAGGTLASADGSFSLKVPPGALATTVDITIQPITNNAWGGTGDAYRLLPDGLTFASPVELVFTVDPQVLAETPPDFLDVAVQSAEGYWYILKNRSYDANSGTLTATTTHFSDYSDIEGLQIRPGAASVGTGGVVNLEVKYCDVLNLPGNINVNALIFDCNNVNGSFTGSNWSVNGIPGGNNSVGRVVQTSVGTAQYTAPGSAPQSNPVAVSVRVPRRRNTETLVSLITIATAFVGTATADLGDGEKIVATVVWQPAGTFQNLETFNVHSGSVVYTPPSGPVGPNCSAASFAPTTATMTPVIDGHLFIDHSTTPATFSGTGVTALLTTASWTCSGVPESQQQLLYLTWFETDVSITPLQVGANGSITGTWPPGNTSPKFTVSFTRGTLPTAPAMVAPRASRVLRVGK